MQHLSVSQCYLPWQEEGYFSAHNPPIGALRKPLDFASLSGEPEYREKVAETYRELQARAPASHCSHFSL